MGMLNAANTALGAGGVAGVFAVDNTTDIIFTYASDGAVSGTISTLDYASDGFIVFVVVTPLPFVVGSSVFNLSFVGGVS